MSNPDEILTFWFEGVTGQTPIDKNKNPFRKWFIKDTKFDQEIRERFEADIQKAARGEYRSWESDARGRLALIILFDQFSRNIYRNTPQAFATDPRASALTLRSLKDGLENQLMAIERVFLYLPLEHSENLEHQKLCVVCYEKLLYESKQNNPKSTAYFEYNLMYANKHYEIVKRFGRFPHRNVILGRASTPQEEEFLTKPGSSF